MLKLLLQFVPGVGPLLADAWGVLKTLLSCPTTWIAIGAAVIWFQHGEIINLRAANASEKQAYTLEHQAYVAQTKVGVKDANTQSHICETRVVTARKSATYTANLLSSPTHETPAGDPQLLSADQLRLATGHP